MRDYSASSTPTRSYKAATTSPIYRPPRFRPNPSLAAAVRSLGKGSVPTETPPNDPAVEERLLDPRTRWTGPGCEIPPTPPPPTSTGRRVPERAYKSKGSAFAKEISPTDESLDRLVHTADSEAQPVPDPRPRSSPLREQQVDHPHHQQQQWWRNSLPPLSAGVPSQGLFSKTRGHYRYRDPAKGMLPVAKLPDRYTNMSDKDSRPEHLEQNGHGVKTGPMMTSAGAGAGAGAVQPATRGQRLAQHFKRWWWLHLLIFICIVVLVVCLIIFVAVPKLAQARVNAAKLSIQGLSVTQTQSTNFTMSINGTIQADDSIHAVIDPFEGVMYLEDWAPQTPFVRLSFPQTTSATETAVNITQFTEILDMNAFTVFNTWLLVNDTVNVTVEGDTHVRISGISKKYPIHFKKTLNVPAMGNFNGTTVPNSTVSLTADAQGDNFHGTAVIPNRSFISFEIGNASFINFLLGANVGTVYIDNMSLYPGNNTLALRGNISDTPVLQDIQKRPYCETGNLPFLLQGLNVTNHGQYLSYYADSLGSTNQSVTIDVGADLTALGLTISCSNTSETKREMEVTPVVWE